MNHNDNDRPSAGTVSTLADNVVRRKPGWALAAAVIVGFVFGSSGVLWDFLQYKSDARGSFRERVELARQLQADMADIQRDILALIPEYLRLRDNRKESVEGKNDYIFAKNRLVKLISDYNALEARRSFVEELQPLWFPISRMITPPPPTNINATIAGPSENGGALFNVSWTNGQDEVLAEVRKDLMRLYEAYGQEYPSDPVPEVNSSSEQSHAVDTPIGSTKDDHTKE